MNIFKNLNLKNKISQIKVFLALSLGFLSFGFFNNGFVQSYTSGLCSPTITTRCEPDNTNGTYSFGTRFKNITPGFTKFTDTSSWSDLTKLPLRLGESFIKVNLKNSSWKTNAYLVNEMNRGNIKSYTFSDNEVTFLKKFIKQNWKTANGDKEQNNYSEGMYASEGPGLTTNLYRSDLPSVFPIEKYKSLAVSYDYGVTGTEKYFDYPIWDIYRYYMTPLWRDYYSNGNSESWWMIKGAMIGFVDGNLYKSDKYIGSSSRPTLSWLIGQAYGVSNDKENLMKVLTYGAYIKKEELVKNASKAYYFDSYLSGNLDSGYTKNRISNWKLNTNNSESGMLGNRYDMPLIFGMELGLVSSYDVIDGTVDCEKISQSSDNLKYANNKCNPNNSYSDSTYSSSNILPRYHNYTINSVNDLQTLVKNIWKKKNEADFASNDYKYLIGSPGSKYFLQSNVVGTPSGLQYYDNSRRADYGEGAYTNLWGSVDYLLLVYKFMTYGVEYKKDTPAAPNYLFSFMLTKSFNAIPDGGSSRDIGVTDKLSFIKKVTDKDETTKSFLNIDISKEGVKLNSFVDHWILVTTLPPTQWSSSLKVKFSAYKNGRIKRTNKFTISQYQFNYKTVYSDGAEVYVISLDPFVNSSGVLESDEAIQLVTIFNGTEYNNSSSKINGYESNIPISCVGDDCDPGTDNGLTDGTSGEVVDTTFDVAVRFLDNNQLGYVRMTSDYENDYDTLASEGVSWKYYPADKLGVIITAKISVGNDYSKQKMLDDYKCYENGSYVYCDVVDLINKNFFKKYSPITVKAKVCNTSGNCSEQELGEIENVLTQTYTNFGYGTIEDKAEIVGYQIYSAEEIFNKFNRAVMPRLSSSASSKIGNIMDSLGGTKFSIYLKFYDENGNERMARPGEIFYKVKKPTYCKVDYTGPSSASSEDSWSSLGTLVKLVSGDSAIKEVDGYIKDDDGSTVGSASNYVGGANSAGVDSSSSLVTSSSADYPVDMKLIVYFDTEKCTNYSQTLYPNIKICPSKVRINNFYVTKDTSNPTKYHLKAYTSYPGSSCGSVLNEKITISYNNTSETINLNNCSIGDDGLLTCDFSLTENVIKYINNNITPDNIKKTLSTKLSFDYSSSTGGGGTSTKTEDVDYQGTCFGKYPYFSIKEINGDKIVDTYTLDTSNSNKVQEFINSFAGNDRRLNKRRWIINYMGCYKPSGLEIKMTKGEDTISTGRLPNKDVKQLYVDNDGNSVNIGDIFSDADQLNEDRINNPEEKALIFNIGYKHFGIKNRPNDIIGIFTDIQNYINNNALDGNYPRPDIDVNLSLTLYQNNSDTTGYTETYYDKVKLFGYCYPYPYLVPYKDKISVQDAIISNIYKDSYITLQYRGCEPLTKIQLGLYGGVLGKQGQKDLINGGDYTLLGLQQYDFNKGDFYDSKMTCNSIDFDKDGIACNSDIDRKVVEAYETVTIPLNLVNKLLINSGKFEDIKNKTKYDFDSNSNIGYRKDTKLSEYFRRIIDNNYIKGSMDNGKLSYLSLYNLINNVKFRLDISAIDSDSTNDIQNGIHDYIGFSTDEEIDKYNRFTIEQMEFYNKPIVKVPEFKVKFLNTNSGKVEDKNRLKQTGIIDISYKVSSKYPDETNSFDQGEYLKPYMIIQVFDPYNNEITLLKKIVELPQDNDHIQVPIYLDDSYPDGIYTVKAQVFDKNDNKIYKDLFSAMFVKRQQPQFTVVLKQLPDEDPKKVAIYNKLNNGYIVDGKGIYNKGYIKTKVYLHDPIEDYEHGIINGEDSLILYVNEGKGGNTVAIPKSEIKYDDNVGLNYVEFYLTNIGIKNTLFGKILEGINTITLKDNYGEKNLNTVKFNIIYTPADGIPTPYIKEDLSKNKLIFSNILLEPKLIKDIKAEEDGIQASSISVYNNNLWLNLGGIIYVKDWTGKTSLKINSKGYKKIKIKDGHLIKSKEYVLNIDGVSNTLANIVIADYDPVNKVGFGFDKNGYLYYIDKSFNITKLRKIISKPQDIYIERVNDGSYSIYTIDNGKLKIFNISGYTTASPYISYDYGPDSTFNNKVYTDGLVSLDKKDDILYVLKKDTDGVMRIIFIPVYQNNLTLSINGQDKVINLGSKSEIDMSMYKELISPIANISLVTNNVGKKFFEIVVKLPEKYNITLGGFVSLNGRNSDIIGLSSTNIIPYEKIELYKNGNLIWAKNLTDVEGSGKKDITITIPYSTDTEMLVIKMITKDGKIANFTIPVIKEVLRLPIPKYNIPDGEYSGTIKVLDKSKNILYSYNTKFLVSNNNIYTDVVLYNSHFDVNNTFKGFENIDGVQIMFYSPKGLINIYHPLEKYISTYALYARHIISNGKTVSIKDFANPTDLKKFNSYVNGQLDGYVKTDTLVKINNIKDLSSFNWDNFGGLFICIDSDTAKKLKFTIEKKYWVIYNDLQKITNNQLEPEKEYLTQEVLNRIKWIKETKLQVCPTNMGDKFINIKDLLKK